jgi:TDG/mug DNA glycosylase family protein
MIQYKVGRGMKILFVGINPHPGSYRRRVPFSNNKTFWYLLNRAGLLEEDESELRKDSGLKQMYDERFLLRYRLGFTNLVDRPTRQVTELRRGEAKPGVERLLRDIRTCRPRIVCFIGKVTYNVFRGSLECDYGWQENIDGSWVYVMHFPIRGPASIRIEELRELKAASSHRK